MEWFAGVTSEGCSWSEVGIMLLLKFLLSKIKIGRRRGGGGGGGQFFFFFFLFFFFCV
jgi:hypothetical protein